MNRPDDNDKPAAVESPIDAQLAAPPAAAEPITATVVAEPDQGARILHSRAAVLATLFLVTGALGIPLLWMNPRFGRTERIVWTIIVSIYTVALIAIVYAIVVWSYQRIMGI